ncbi:uncharacterized protein LOC129900188 [Solanum dulcamara]|uniref:uncharacterized protein LOC129900188 n=1 Tax=Solanum dulcamara TaxID=45834 RepID=UPI0024860D41|nr:uncharacterized protein LOC129900188 [Solanum dulcamara]
MGTAAPHITTVNKLTMRNGPIISHEQQIALCAKVTDIEIFDGLRSIGDDKAPGVDGFNAMFFKKTCIVIQQDVCAAVGEFFCYRENVLANRIETFIASVISDIPAGFIPGRKGTDNIILAHELVKANSRKNISPRCMIKIDIQKAYDRVD